MIYTTLQRLHCSGNVLWSGHYPASCLHFEQHTLEVRLPLRKLYNVDGFVSEFFSYISYGYR